jgi:hypothetical protein
LANGSRRQAHRKRTLDEEADTTAETATEPEAAATEEQPADRRPTRQRRSHRRPSDRPPSKPRSDGTRAAASRRRPVLAALGSLAALGVWRRLPLSRRQRLGLLLVAGLAVAALVWTLGSHLLDEPLRRQLESRMNQQLHGYTLRLGHAHAGLLGLDLTLRDVVMRQQDFPEPPVATIPLLHLSVEWPELFARHLVGDAYFEQPHLHLNVEQLHVEEVKRARLGQRGWQAALQSIYPLKFNTMKVHDGSLTYVDGDPTRPFEITHWMLVATNIRNLHYPDRVYPSPIQTEGAIFGTGRGVIEGNANFLAQPFPGVHALCRIDNVPLDRLQQLSTRGNVELHGGVMSARGELEYAPRVKLVHVAEVLFDRVRLDYVHMAATEQVEREHARAVMAAAQQAESSPIVMRVDRARLTGGQVGYVNKKTNPPYRLFVDRAELEILNLSNHAASHAEQPAVLRLRGRFMGGGTARLDATFRAEDPAAELAGELAIEKAQLPAFNDLLRAYKKMDTAGGTVSIYSQITVKSGRLRGYVKTLFDDVKLYDAQKDRKKSFGAKLKEKVLGGLAGMLENKQTDALATRTEITGTLKAPRANTGQILSGLFRNAFSKAIVPGFDNATRQGGQRGRGSKQTGN